MPGARGLRWRAKEDAKATTARGDSSIDSGHSAGLRHKRRTGLPLEYLCLATAFLAIEAKEWTLYSERALKQTSHSVRAQTLRRLDDESVGALNVRFNLHPVPSQRGLTVQPATDMIPLRHRHTAQHEPFSVCS